MTNHVNWIFTFEGQFFKQMFSEETLVLRVKSGYCMLASGDQGIQLRMVSPVPQKFIVCQSHGQSTPGKKSLNINEEPLEVTEAWLQIQKASLLSVFQMQCDDFIADIWGKEKGVSEALGREWL